MIEPLTLGAEPYILALDDEAAIGNLIRASARHVGMRCTATTTHRDFRAALGADVTLIVLDLLMPDADGIELLRELAAERCRAHVILLSGMDGKVLRTAEELARSLGLRTAGSLRKPFRIKELQELLVQAHTVREDEEHPTFQLPALAPAALVQALDEGRIVMHYQPQLHLTEGRVAGIEALVRIVEEDGTLVYPDRFINVAEEHHLIDRLTNAVIRRAFHEFGTLSEWPRLKLAINVSALSLTDLSFPEKVVALAESYHVDPAHVVIEITESGLINDLGTALDILTRLRMRGIGLSIDDFGTGSSAMVQLRHIPATELKVDRTFVRDMLRAAAAGSMVERTIELGHDLEMVVVAEGVETAEQAEALRAYGCEFGQGYYFSRPMPIDELRRLLEQHDPVSGARTSNDALPVQEPAA